MARGLLLTGPVPGAALCSPRAAIISIQSLVLAFARIESRFQNGATSPVGARGIMQMMPTTADHCRRHGRGGHSFTIPSYSLSLGQRYIAQLLRQLDGNLLELGGAYNAGPLAVDRWLHHQGGQG